MPDILAQAQHHVSELRRIAALPTDQTASPEQCAAVAIAMDAFGMRDDGVNFLVNEAVKHYEESIRLRLRADLLAQQLSAKAEAPRGT